MSTLLRFCVILNLEASGKGKGEISAELVFRGNTSVWSIRLSTRLSRVQLVHSTLLSFLGHFYSIEYELMCEEVGKESGKLEHKCR